MYHLARQLYVFYILFFAINFNANRLLAKELNFDPENTKIFGDLWKLDDLDEIKGRFKFFSKLAYPYDPLNFGVVINNQHYKIYRSKSLGHAGIEEIFTHLKEQNLPQPKRIIFVNKDGYKNSFGSQTLSTYNHFFNSLHFFAYEQAQAFSDQGKYSDVTFYHPFNSQVYLSGQNPLDDVESHSLSSVANPEIYEYFRQDLDRGEISSVLAHRSNLLRVLTLILDSQTPVLFHCTGGLHRTGMLALSIRYLQGGVWTKAFKKPLEVKVGLLRKVRLRNLAEIEYYLHNSIELRKKNLESIRHFSQTESFRKLAEKYRAHLNLPSRYVFEL